MFCATSADLIALCLARESAQDAVHFGILGSQVVHAKAFNVSKDRRSLDMPFRHPCCGHGLAKGVVFNLRKDASRDQQLKHALEISGGSDQCNWFNKPGLSKEV